MEDGKKKIIAAKRIKRNKRKTCAEGKGIERNLKEGEAIRMYKRTHEFRGGEKWHRAECQDGECENVSSSKKFSSHEKLNYFIVEKQKRFTHLLVFAFVLKHHHSVLVQHCLGRHFFNNQFPYSRKSMCAGTRLLVERYREMYIALSRKLPTAPKCLVVLPLPVPRAIPVYID